MIKTGFCFFSPDCYAGLNMAERHQREDISLWAGMQVILLCLCVCFTERKQVVFTIIIRFFSSECNVVNLNNFYLKNFTFLSLTSEEIGKILYKEHEIFITNSVNFLYNPIQIHIYCKLKCHKYTCTFNSLADLKIFQNLPLYICLSICLTV